MTISCNPGQYSRIKHIHTRYHFIKEQVENGIIELYFVRTEYQLADMFTKALPEDGFKYLVKRIGMRCLTPAEPEGRMPTKIELTLEQSQQGVSNDVLVSIEGVEELKRNVWIKGENKAALHYTLGRNRASGHVFRPAPFGGVTDWYQSLAEVPIVPADPLVALEVRLVSVTSTTEVLDLVDYSSFDSDPSEDSLPPAPELPLVSPFLCSDDSETNNTSLGSPLDSLSNTSSIHSSGCDASGQTHSGPSTRVASSRSLDSSSISVGPSHKRCRSPTTLVPSSTPVSRSIAPTMLIFYHLARGIGDGVDTKDGIGIGVEIAASDIKEDKEEFEAEASVGGTIKITIDLLVTGGISESTRGDVPDIKDTLYDKVHYMSEVPLDKITEFETAQRQLEAGQLMASGERAGLTDRIRRLGLENLMVRALLCIERDRVDRLRHHMALSQEEFYQIRRDRDDVRRRLRRLKSFRVAEALANYEATRAANALEAESQSKNGNDGDNGNGGNRNENHGDGGNNENRNPNENGRGAMPVARVCTYQDFVKYQPLNFNGTKGVVGHIIPRFRRYFFLKPEYANSVIIRRIRIKQAFVNYNLSLEINNDALTKP
uniref:Retrovirus-related Pol polyprotein from transposon TNT 1-94 n=1 Tax=Tanacetum cinerariifolium TaxID=118510 RepID=A0A699GW63_TANCI|nr:retrovirus-related Pol polyprotein from transposon TNT 1-94 [Tanacetum cinerariifolium]